MSTPYFNDSTAVTFRYWIINNRNAVYSCLKSRTTDLLEIGQKKRKVKNAEVFQIRMRSFKVK